MARKAGGGMTVAEAGRMGGRLVSEKYGPEFYEKIGKKGGSSTANKYGPEFFGRIGKKGGRAVTAKYGAGHFERIGRKGGQKVADHIRSDPARPTSTGRSSSAGSARRVAVRSPRSTAPDTSSVSVARAARRSLTSSDLIQHGQQVRAGVLRPDRQEGWPCGHREVRRRTLRAYRSQGRPEGR